MPFPCMTDAIDIPFPALNAALEVPPVPTTSSSSFAAVFDIPNVMTNPSIRHEDANLVIVLSIFFLLMTFRYFQPKRALAF